VVEISTHNIKIKVLNSADGPLRKKNSKNVKIHIGRGPDAQWQNAQVIILRLGF
jgi:hypothetical protein